MHVQNLQNEKNGSMNKFIEGNQFQPGKSGNCFARHTAQNENNQCPYKCRQIFPEKHI